MVISRFFHFPTSRSARCSAALPWAAGIALGLTACLGNTGSKVSPPSDVQVYPGDGAISVAWNQDPHVQYWVFYAQDPTLNMNNWFNLLGSGVLVNTGSPAIICNRINNPHPLFNDLFPDYYFMINGRTGSSPGGSGSSLVSATPRPAGGPQSGWVAGNAIPGAVSSLGYAAISGCGYAGRPPSGVYVATGPAGAIYDSFLTPNVAGDLTPAGGNSTMTWTRANVPIGFGANLNAVAALSYATTANNPGVADYILVAVGDNGSVLRSTDAQNWELISGVPTSSNLHGVAVAGANFVAVGDNGIIVTSADGLTWNVNANATNASTNTLNAIRCVSSTCVAVGANGTTLWSTDGGTNWALTTVGVNNWSVIAYGNNDANADAVVSSPNGVLALTAANEAIGTWVVADASGNYAHANTVGGWTVAPSFASSIAAIDYTTRFVALDAAGNAFASEDGFSWAAVGGSNVLNAVAMRSNGQGYVVVGSSGANASAF